MRGAYYLLLLSLSLILFSCRGGSAGLTIIDGTQILPASAKAHTPAEMLAKNGITMMPDDRLLVNGLPALPDQPLTSNARSLQIRRATPIILVTPQGQRVFNTSALTVGEALHDAGIQLYAADFLDPPAWKPIQAEMVITYLPSRELTVTTRDGETRIRSSAGTVGAALAGAGMPLIGLDTSFPAELEALPEDGHLRVSSITESIQITQKPIPYETEMISSDEVALGEQTILQAGQEGLAMRRVRIRYEDGQEVSRITEDESVVRPPQARIVQTGTKAVVSTGIVDGLTLDYWRVYEMYATVYSPCNSGIGSCAYGTASGLPAGKGVVAVDPSLYSYLQGQRIYVSGYGYAVIGDVGGGYLVEQMLGVSRYRWIDLGFDDNNIVDMTGWVTVYFLSPAPAAVPPALQ